MSTETHKSQIQEKHGTMGQTIRKKTERRSFLKEAAAVAGGAALLATGRGKGLAQECPKRDLTLDELKAFTRDLAVAIDVDMEEVNARLEVVEQYLRPLTDVEGRIPEGYHAILIRMHTGPR